MGIYPPQVPEDAVLSASGHISALKVCMCGKWCGIVSVGMKVRIS